MSIADQVPLSVSYLTYRELPPPEAITAAAAAGCAHISLRLTPRGPQPPNTEIMADPELFANTRRRLASEGISVLDVEVIAIDEAFDPAAQEHLLGAAAELGARHVLTTVNDPDEVRRAENFAALCQSAARYDLTIDLEFVSWRAVGNISQAQALLDRVAQPNAGILVDPLHVDRGTTTNTQIAQTPRHLLRFMQFCDGARLVDPTEEELVYSAINERLFPGEGVIDLRGIMQAMPRMIPMSLEIPRAELAKTIPAAERVRLAVAATRRLLEHIRLT